jgi:nucleoside-diphosphate-sugar epimerase
VRVLDAATPPAWQEGLEVDVDVGDVTDGAAVNRALAGADVLIHAAFAPPHAPPDRMRAVNLEGTRMLCEAASAAGVRQVVLVSSTIVTADARRHPVRTAALNRLDAYRATRMEAERLARAASSPSMSVAVVRPKTFVGPGRVGGFALVFDLIRSGRPVPLAGPGTNRYQLLDVRDLAGALATLTAVGGEGLYQLGATRFGTIAEDLGSLIEAAGTGARLRRLPAPLGRALVRGVELAGLAPLAEWHHSTARSVDSVVDVGRAQRELGWEPTRSNEEALLDAYRWYVHASADGEAATTHPVPRSHRGLRRLAGGVRR